MLCAANVVMGTSVDIASEWRLVRHLSPAKRLEWLERTPGVEIHFGSSLPVMLAKISRLIDKSRVRFRGLMWEDVRFPERRRLTTECLCDDCKERRRWPNYYGQGVVKRELDRAPRRGWISYECWLQSLPAVEEGIPVIPGSRSIVPV